MTIRLPAFALAATALFLSSAAAEESLDELKERLQKVWEPWKGCEAGSWIETKSKYLNGSTSTESESRQTMVSRDEKNLTFETRTVKRSKDAEGREVVELGEPQTSTMPVATQTGGYQDLKDLRHEEVEVAGKKLDCRVVEATYVTRYAQPMNGVTETKTKITMWISPEVRELGGLVRTEADTDNKAAMMGTGSADMTLLESGKDLKIGENTVKCSVYRYGNATGKEEMTSTGEVWASTEIPWGYAKTKIVMNFKTGATTMRMEAEMEVMGMNIVKAKSE